MEIRYNQKQFIAGEVGERADGLRDSDAFKVSAKGIENMLITGMGTLKAAKQFEIVDRVEITGDVIKAISTKYTFDIVVTTEEVLIYQKDTYVKLSEMKLKNNIGASIEFIDNSLFTPNKIIDIDPVSHAMTENTKYKSEGLEPLKDHSQITVDLYQVRKLIRIEQDPNHSDKTIKVEYFMPVKIGTVLDQEFDYKSDGLHVKGTGNKIVVNGVAMEWKRFSTVKSQHTVHLPSDNASSGEMRIVRNGNMRILSLDNVRVAHSSSISGGGGYIGTLLTLDPEDYPLAHVRGTCNGADGKFVNLDINRNKVKFTTNQSNVQSLVGQLVWFV